MTSPRWPYARHAPYPFGPLSRDTPGLSGNLEGVRELGDRELGDEGGVAIFGRRNVEAWPCSSANAVSSARRRLGKRTVEGELRDPHGDGAVLSTAMMAAVRRVPARRLLPLFSQDDFWGFTAPSAGSVHRIEMTQAPALAAS